MSSERKLGEGLVGPFNGASDNANTEDSYLEQALQLSENNQNPLSLMGKMISATGDYQLVGVVLAHPQVMKNLIINGGREGAEFAANTLEIIAKDYPGMLSVILLSEGYGNPEDSNSTQSIQWLLLTEQAERICDLERKYNAPLLINDPIETAVLELCLAGEAAGVVEYLRNAAPEHRSQFLENEEIVNTLTDSQYGTEHMEDFSKLIDARYAPGVKALPPDFFVDGKIKVKPPS